MTMNVHNLIFLRHIYGRTSVNNHFRDLIIKKILKIYDRAFINFAPFHNPNSLSLAFADDIYKNTCNRSSV